MSDDHTDPSGGRSSQDGGGSRSPRKSSDLYAAVTQRMIELLEKGVVPWRSPILSHRVGYPQNLITRKPYRGVNVFLLAVTRHFMGYDSAYWATFRQIQQAGGHVRRGERATLVVFYKQHEFDDEQTGEKKRVPLLRHFNVFNLTQCDGITPPDPPPAPAKPFVPIEEAARIVEGYKDGPAIEHRGSRACYTPTTDTISIAEPGRFATPEEYYATLFHELAHSTGHSKRLDRGLDKNLRPFGSPDYSREELVAEMAAAFLCGQADIHPAVIENQTAYLKAWLGRLREDSKLLITAASAAQRAAEWIRPCGEPDSDEPNPPLTGSE